MHSLTLSRDLSGFCVSDIFYPKCQKTKPPLMVNEKQAGLYHSVHVHNKLAYSPIQTETESNTITYLISHEIRSRIMKL